MSGRRPVYIKEGTARTPVRRLSAPPRCTGNRLGGPKAEVGSWQPAQDNLPEADKDLSKNNCRPTATMAAADGGGANVSA
jgi:hypothetical protein